MPWFGDMPSGSESPTCASSAWWLEVVALLVLVARCHWLLERPSLQLPPISSSFVLLAGSLNLKPGSSSWSFSTSCQGGRRGETRRETEFRREVSPVRFRSSFREACQLERRRPLLIPVVDGRSPRSYAAHHCIGGRRAVPGGLHLYFLVEGQPFGVILGSPYSSRPMCQKGDSLTLYCCSIALSPAGWWRRSGESLDPSGFVPGIDGFDPGLGLWTGLQISSVLWGPYCKKHGLVCNFPLCLGPCVNWRVLFTLLSPIKSRSFGALPC